MRGFSFPRIERFFYFYFYLFIFFDLSVFKLGVGLANLVTTTIIPTTLNG